ncbi:LiaF transmembrane domain-containing protein [Pseudoduganella umbonata]|uniref:LiaF transmembrane domain-containing protein n=1 Tax=Pseudoduganella umbonata TaxID=864828 RepID=A0A4P8HKW5_9BURK|nr:hypothetical protein [Pseudoduganella umbonata]MBB3221758.1 hypothetical protein [Pseudoduganella umbonata]QCP09024.1 hypothetical protein FCL38_00165 [Pseudoduganella umbonata]
MQTEMDRARLKLRRQVIWGLTLVAFGVAYLVNRDDHEAVIGLWTYWPLVLIAFGVGNMLPPVDGRRFVDGLSQVLFGAWFYATYEGLWGLTFRNSWPLLIIVAGAGMVLQPLATRYFDRKLGEEA